ncbi:MAG: immunity protein 32 [Acidobacteria bacterium]|nr:immunity protein 32 [Acidobacteriota bacterium]
MLLTFEYNTKGVVEIFMDKEGRRSLIESLERLSPGETKMDHDHLMTPAWAGAELTDEVQNAENQLINMVTVFLVRDELNNDSEMRDGQFRAL